MGGEFCFKKMPPVILLCAACRTFNEVVWAASSLLGKRQIVFTLLILKDFCFIERSIVPLRQVLDLILVCRIFPPPDFLVDLAHLAQSFCCWAQMIWVVWLDHFGSYQCYCHGSTANWCLTMHFSFLHHLCCYRHLLHRYRPSYYLMSYTPGVFVVH